MKNKIILEAETQLKDNELRKWVQQLFTKIETLNERTKNHTRYIKELEKKIRKLKVFGI